MAKSEVVRTDFRVYLYAIFFKTLIYLSKDYERIQILQQIIS